MAKPFTDKLLISLKAKEKKYYQREGRGFTLRVLPSGVKTFLYIYTFEGKRKEHNLGIYSHGNLNGVKLADAREQYGIAYTKVRNGIDPSYVEPIDVEEFTTFGHWSDEYLKWSEKNHVPDLYRINKGSLKKDVLPFWKDKPLLEIRRKDAIALLNRVTDRAAGQTYNVHRAARGVFQHAVEMEYTEYNPLLRLTKPVPSLKYTPRKRALSEVEIKALWPQIPAYLKLVLVTAQRPGEVAGMHRREITDNWWTIPHERARKGKGDHLVYLTKTALELIGEADAYIFPSSKPDKPIERVALSGHVHKHKYFNLPRWTPHDLRRTARTFMEDIGIPEAHSEAVLAHEKKGMIKVYNLSTYKKEKKAALIKWEAELLRIVSSKDTKL